jgi:glycosyltransferase involved in cell wall biosynthesis
MILCQGPAWQKFSVTFLRFAPEYAPIVSNWTATPALLNIGRNRCFTLRNRPVHLLFVGWLDQEKGIHELIEACQRLARSHQFVLNIVGEGNASAAVREAITRHNLSGIIRLSGWLDGPDLHDALAEADVFVLPSWSEGLPNAMIEAMAAKLAVVVSSVGNIPDVVVQGCEALLVAPRDVAALQSALARVIEDPDLRRRLGDAGFSLAERQFGVEPAVDRILAAVQKITSPVGHSEPERMVS